MVILSVTSLKTKFLVKRRALVSRERSFLKISTIRTRFTVSNTIIAMSLSPLNSYWWMVFKFGLTLLLRGRIASRECFLHVLSEGGRIQQ